MAAFRKIGNPGNRTGNKEASYTIFQNMMEKKETKIICFANNKNRCGKTTTVAAVGQTWADCKFKVLLVDLDAQATLTSMITGTDPAKKKWERTIENALIERKGLPIAEISEYMHIVPADMELSNFERVTSYMQGREFLLSDLLESVKGEYDYILIDCPSSLGMLTYNALLAANYLIIVTNAEAQSYRGMNMVLDLYREIHANKRLNPTLSVAGVFVTQYAKEKMAELYLELIKKDTGPILINPVIRKSRKFVQAPGIQKSIFELDPEGKTVMEYRKGATDLVLRIEGGFV